MGVTVTKRIYDNRYRDEEVDWLLGNVGDWQTLSLYVDVSIEKTATQSKPIFLERGGLDWVLSDGTKWSNYGFDVGDEITIAFNYEWKFNENQPALSGTFSKTRKIDLLMGGKMRINEKIEFLKKDMTIPFKDGNFDVYSVLIYSDKDFEGLELQYGHLTNEDAEGGVLNSFIDGTETRFLGVFEDINNQQNGDLIPIGFQSGMSVKGGAWEYLGQKEETFTGIFGLEYQKKSYKRQFKVSIEFLISSFFEDLSNFETMTAPSQVFDAESLTDNFSLKFFPEWNNPNMYVANDMKETERLGNTGWFNENFNGLKNNFNVDSVEYLDPLSNTVLQSLSLSSSVRVRAKISGINNLQNGLTKLGLGFIFLPEDEEIFNKKETPFHQNLFINTAGGVNSGVFTPSTSSSNVDYAGFTNKLNSEMKISNVKFEIVSGILVFEADFKPTAGFSDFIDELDEEDKNYAIWLSVADHEKETNFSDRVSLLLDYNIFRNFVPPVGEYEPMVIGFYEHPQDENDDMKSGECGKFFVEDDILARVDFGLDRKKEKIPTKLEYVIEIENTKDGRKHELDRHVISLVNFPILDGVPQWDYDASRGFKYDEGNNKNFIKLKRNEDLDDEDVIGYTGLYGFKIRWEDWIKRLSVPQDFYNEDAENKGYNNDWANYIEKEDWQIQFTVYTHTELAGQMVKYVNEEIFTFKDYNSNETIETEWSFIREKDGVELPVTLNDKGEPVGVLLDEMMRLRVKYKKIGGNFVDIRKYYGTICVEEANGAGYKEFRQLSSVWGSESDNPLKPLKGEGFLKMTGGLNKDIVLECLINPKELKGFSFKLSSRLGCLYECAKLSFDKKTKFFFFFDNSGSMNSTLKPLEVVRDTMLKDRLLKFYGGDEDLYAESVKIIKYGGEQTFDVMNMQGIEPPEGKVIVFNFQDEADNCYQVGVEPNDTFKSDFETFIQRLNSFPSKYYRGCIFQVSGGNGVGSGDAWDKFRDMIKGVENNIAPYQLPYSLLGRNEVAFEYDLEDGAEPQYYMDFIVKKLTELGYNI